MFIYKQQLLPVLTRVRILLMLENIDSRGCRKKGIANNFTYLNRTGSQLKKYCLRYLLVSSCNRFSYFSSLLTVSNNYNTDEVLSMIV